jgi:hypothetical protein
VPAPATATAQATKGEESKSDGKSSSIDLSWDEKASRFTTCWNFAAVVNTMIFAAAMAALFSGAPPNPGVAFRQYTETETSTSMQTRPGACSVRCEVAADTWFSVLWGATATSSMAALGICSFWATVLLRCHSEDMYKEFMNSMTLLMPFNCDITFWPPFLTAVAGLLATASLLYSLFTVFGLGQLIWLALAPLGLPGIAMIVYLKGNCRLVFQEWRDNRKAAKGGNAS